MSLKVVVKVGAVNNLSDARYCAGMSVDMIGFDFNSSSDNFTSPEKFKEIAEWLSGVDFVGEFDGVSAKEIEQSNALDDIRYIQVDDINILNQIAHLPKEFILKTSVDQLTEIGTQAPLSYIIIAGDEELTLAQKETIKSITSTYKILVGTGIDANNSEDIVNFTNAKGISLVGGNEIRPGYKDYDELADILEALDEDY